MYFIIVADDQISNKNSYWNRGHGGFVLNEPYTAAQFPNAEEAYVELVDENLTDIAHVRAVQPIGG